jgi:rhodanese-related sulfurtransferase
VPGAKLIPVDQLDPLDPSFAGYTKEEPLYVICAAGGRSRQAATKLAAAGYNVINVEGGTNAWKGAGYPVE